MAHVRFDFRPDDHGPVPDLPPLLTATAPPACEVCGGPVPTSKPARCCSARCRAEASRRRRAKADRIRLDAAEAALLDALRLVGELRADLARRAA